MHSLGLRSLRHDQSLFKLTSLSKHHGSVDCRTDAKQHKFPFLKSKLDNIPLKLSPRGSSYKPKGAAQLSNPTTQSEWPLVLLQRFNFAERMYKCIKYKLKKNMLFPLSKLAATGQHHPEWSFHSNKNSLIIKPWQSGHSKRGKARLPPHSLTCGAQILFSIAHQLPRLVCGCWTRLLRGPCFGWLSTHPGSSP